jgi:predicted phage-related endonuclease
MHNVKANIINLKVNKKNILNIIYMDIIEVCEEIKEDMHKMEEDSKKIDCYAILDLILHSFKCFIDSIKCCFKIKVY